MNTPPRNISAPEQAEPAEPLLNGEIIQAEIDASSSPRNISPPIPAESAEPIENGEIIQAEIDASSTLRNISPPIPEESAEPIENDEIIQDEIIASPSVNNGLSDLDNGAVFPGNVLFYNQINAGPPLPAPEMNVEMVPPQQQSMPNGVDVDTDEPAINMMLEDGAVPNVPMPNGPVPQRANNAPRQRPLVRIIRPNRANTGPLSRIRIRRMPLLPTPEMVPPQQQFMQNGVDVDTDEPALNMMMEDGAVPNVPMANGRNPQRAYNAARQRRFIRITRANRANAALLPRIRIRGMPISARTRRLLRLMKHASRNSMQLLRGVKESLNHQMLIAQQLLTEEQEWH